MLKIIEINNPKIKKNYQNLYKFVLLLLLLPLIRPLIGLKTYKHFIKTPLKPIKMLLKPY